jgi:hypothetical protein
LTRRCGRSACAGWHSRDAEHTVRNVRDITGRRRVFFVLHAVQIIAARFVVRCMLYRSLLHVLLYVACCLPRALAATPHLEAIGAAVRAQLHVLRVARLTLRVARLTLRVARLTLRVARLTLRVARRFWRSYTCCKCGTPLGTTTDLLAHEMGMGQQAFARCARQFWPATGCAETEPLHICAGTVR